MKIVSWNVNGIRAAIKKNFAEFVAAEKPDVLCVQETKARQEQVDMPAALGAYSSSWAAAQRGGYSGVATFSKKQPKAVEVGLGIPRFDDEGRVVCSVYEDFTLYNVYFPNGGRGPERVAYKLEFYAELLKQMEARRKKGESIVVLGDYNTAYAEIDLARPKENQKTSGFLPEERAWVHKYFDKGYVDCFRHFEKGGEHYTWWDMKTGARARNIGWRIDYVMISPDLLPRLKSARHLPDVMGSDHCPIEIVLK